MFVSLNLMQSFEILFLMRGRPHQNAIYNIDNPVGLKLLTRLRLSCSHLNKHRFNHKFENCINTLSSCSLEIESTSHFLLHCHHYTNIHLHLWNSIAEMMVVPWCSGYHYCTASFNLVWTQVLRRFKPCSQRVGDSRWWGSLTMVPAGNKAKHLSSVNHTTKTIHHHHK